jgi:hypothetical protein
VPRILSGIIAVHRPRKLDQPCPEVFGQLVLGSLSVRMPAGAIIRERGCFADATRRRQLRHRFASPEIAIRLWQLGLFSRPGFFVLPTASLSAYQRDLQLRKRQVSAPILTKLLSSTRLTWLFSLGDGDASDCGSRHYWIICHCHWFCSYSLSMGVELIPMDRHPMQLVRI